MRRCSSSHPPLVVLIAVSWLLGHNPQLCSGSEDASFRRPPPPPPPPGSSFSDVPVAERGTGYGENPVGSGSAEDYNGYGYNTQQQQQQQQQYQQEEPFPSRYPDEYGNNNDDDYGVGVGVGRPQERPPPGGTGLPRPPPSTPERKPEIPAMPIHYEFPAASSDPDMGEGRRRRGGRRDDNDGEGMTSSARKDLVTQYWSTKRGKLQIQSVIGLVGYGLGSFGAKVPTWSRWSGCFWAAVLVVSTWFRTALGELSRAVGLSLILVLQRHQRIRREYPTWRYVAASVGIIRGGPRDARGKPRGPRPFPPARNPWRYSPRDPRDPDFNMMYALGSMALVGSTVGGNLPFVPGWIGALGGAAVFAFACTWQESYRGDLARTMGMRVVRAVSELWEIQADLQIIPKATVVSSQMIDRAMILDRKHKVKDRFLSLANSSYARATKVAEQIQQQQRGGKDGENRDRRSGRDDDDDDDDRDARSGDRRGRDRGGSGREKDRGGRYSRDDDRGRPPRGRR
eukprot:jgi/Psemu1/42772/gm1.42772_g